jgi:hypothetical protein
MGGVAFGDTCKILLLATHYHFNIHNNTCWFFPALGTSIGMGSHCWLLIFNSSQLDCDVKVIRAKEEKTNTAPRTLSLVIHPKFDHTKGEIQQNKNPSILVVN